MLGRAPYDNPMIIKNVDSEIFNEINPVNQSQNVLKEYLEYCLLQAEKGHPYSRTLKHVFGLNKGLRNAKSYRRLLLETIQQNNLKKNMEDLISMV